MAYRLALTDDPPSALRRCAREQIEDAVAMLDERGGDDPAEAIHEARKSVKKTRALLRIARPALPRRSYRMENHSLRDAARSASGLRDADVMVETVDGLKERFSGVVPAKSFASVKRPLATQARAAHRDDDAVIDALSGDLKEALQRIDSWPLDDAGWKAVRRGAIRSYRRARKAGDAALDEPSAEALHEWRKRVKDFWYHQRLVEEAWPRVIKAQAKEAHELSDVLGDHHDLAVLMERLSDGDKPPGGTGRDDVLALAAQRQEGLLAVATRLGRLLFAEPPKRYGRRLKSYMRSGAAEGRLPVPA